MPGRFSLLIVFATVTSVPFFFAGLKTHPPLEGAALGRSVYIAEGCIHCHSQYIRPETMDSSLWGDARDPDFSREQNPGLIGNRRQGPDLMNVGLRRTRDWQRLHLVDPREVVPASRMPSYAHLFAPGDARGEALIDYLESLGRESAIAAPDEPAQSDAITSR